jgi:hypothetical protein
LEDSEVAGGGRISPTFLASGVITLPIHCLERLRQLSEESGIPLGILKRWWHEQEKEKFKNEPNPESQTISKRSDNELTASDHPICVVCGEQDWPHIDPRL